MSQISDQRPLSPHLSIYRWLISNTLSILHRLTGFALTLGLIPLAAWIWAIAYDPDLYTTLSGLFASIVGKLCLFGWTFAFYYHLGNGLRHLNWDLGRGFALPEMARSGWLVVTFAVCITIFTWSVILNNLGA